MEPEFRAGRLLNYDARDVFSKFPPAEQILLSHLMLVSASPTENNGDAPWARSYVHIFRSPDFQAEQIPFWKIGAIGSGNFVEECRELIEELSTNREAAAQLMHGEVLHPGGTGEALGWRATTVLKRCRPNGISSHLHYCWVFRGRIVIQANDHITYGRWTNFPLLNLGPENVEKLSGTNPITGEPEDEFRHTFAMPPIAQSWEELEKLLSAQGATAKGAVG